MRFVLASRLCNSSLLIKHTKQMRAQGVINANYPRGPRRTQSAGGLCGGSRGKCMQGSNSAAVLAAIKQLQQSEQVSVSWPVKELGRHLWMVMKDHLGTGFASFRERSG